MNVLGATHVSLIINFVMDSKSAWTAVGNYIQFEVDSRHRPAM